MCVYDDSQRLNAAAAQSCDLIHIYTHTCAINTWHVSTGPEGLDEEEAEEEDEEGHKEQRRKIAASWICHENASDWRTPRP